ncbi:MAG: hypothetical protein KIT43_10150 [Bauldia sp.]|nr:hypothetical protein [Bauldia sp.]
MRNGSPRALKQVFGAPWEVEKWNHEEVLTGPGGLGHPDDIVVTGPDGKLYAFPAGTSQATIAMKMRQLAETHAGTGVYSQGGKQAPAWPTPLQQERTALQMGRAYFAYLGIPVPAWDPARPAPPLPNWSLPPAQQLQAIADYTSYVTSNPRRYEPDPVGAFFAGLGQGLAGDAIEVGMGLFDPEAARGFRRDYEVVEEARPWFANAGEWAGGLVADLSGPFVAGVHTALGWIADAIVGDRPDVARLLMDQNGIAADLIEPLMPSRPGRDWFDAGADLTNEAIDARDIVEGYDPATLPVVTRDQDPYRPRVGPNDMQLLARAIETVYGGGTIHDPATLPPAYWFGGVEADLGSPAAQPFDFGDLGMTMFPESFYEARGIEPMLPFFLPADPQAESYFFFPAGTDYEAAWADVMNWRDARGLYPR